MKVTKDYYATAQCFARCGTGSIVQPKEHRYILLKDFDDDALQLVNEITLSGEWPLLNGKKSKLDFERSTVSNGRELSEITQYTGQSYKRTPLRKTFCITMKDFVEANRFFRKTG